MMMLTQSRTGRRNVYAVKKNGYRFGFNGQEKSDEIRVIQNQKGNRQLMTGLFLFFKQVFIRSSF